MNPCKLIFITILLLLLAFSNSTAQTTKGMWLTGGQFSFTQTTALEESNSGITIAPELGYVFLHRWMVWGQINIDLQNQFSTVGHQLSLRYAFLKQPSLEGYTGLKYTFTEQRFLTNGNFNKTELLTIGPLVGYLHFLNPGVAFDLSMHYPMYHKLSRVSFNNIKNGSLELKLGLNFYFNSKLEKDTLPPVHCLQKGQWLIGGSMALGGGNDLSLFSRSGFLNHFQPYAGVLLSKRWMVGSRLSYYNSANLTEWYFGAEPFGRYYFKTGKKRFFYGEANLVFHFRNSKLSNLENGFTSSERSGGLGLGMSRWIVPGVALDFYLGSKWGEQKFRFSNEFTFVQEVNLRIGLEGYF